MVVTMPSPTRAMMVSSVAPPTKRSRLVRTVTRALALMTMPSLATASMVVLPEVGAGQSMTLGLTEVLTASSTVLPVPLVARSMAQARSKSRWMPALRAAMSASDHHLDVAAGQEVRGEIVDGDVQAGLHGGDAGVDDHADRHAAQAQGDQFGEGDLRARGQGAQPDEKEVEDDEPEDQEQDHCDGRQNQSPQVTFAHPLPSTEQRNNPYHPFLFSMLGICLLR